MRRGMLAGLVKGGTDMPRHLVWVGAFALALGLLAVALPAPPAAAQGPDEAQVAKVREILTGIGYADLQQNGIGAPGLGDEIPPVCQLIPLTSGSPAEPTVIGTQLLFDDHPDSMDPGDTRTYFTVYLFSTEYLDCANAWAKQQYDFMSGKSYRYRDGDPFTVGSSPAVVAANYFRSKLQATRGDRIYSMSGSDGTLNCGNIRVDLGTVLMDSQGERNYHAELTAEGKTKARQKLTEIGQALANANVCSGSWQSPVSATPGPFAVGLGCQYSAEEGVLCSTRTSNQPAGAGPNDITYEWTYDGTLDGRTTGDTYARPDADVTPGEHTITVRAIDNRTKTPSSSERWTFSKAGGGGAPAVAGFTLTVSCTKQGEQSGVVNSEVAVVCEAKPSGVPADAPLSYTWSWDGPPVPGATGSILTSKSIPPGDTATHVVTVKATDPTGATSPVASTSVARSSSPLSFIPPEIWAGVNNVLTGTPDPTPPDPSEDSGGLIIVSVILGTAAAAAAALGGKAADSPLASGLATAAGGVADAVSGITAPTPAVKPAAGAAPGASTAIKPASGAQSAPTQATGSQAGAVAAGVSGPATAAAATTASGPPSGTSAEEAPGIGDAMGILDGTFGEGLQAAGGARGAPADGGSASLGPPAGTSTGQAAPSPVTVKDPRQMEDERQAGDLKRQVLTGATLTGDPFSVMDGKLPDATGSPEAAAAAAATRPAREVVEDLAAINVGTPSDHLEHVDPGIELEADLEHKRLDMDQLREQAKDASARKQQLEKDGQAGTDAFRSAGEQVEATKKQWSEAFDDWTKARASLDLYRKDHPASGSPGAGGAGSGKPGGPGR